MLEEYGGGVAVIRFGPSTVQLAALTPPNVTDVMGEVPAKPEPRIVTGPGSDCDPPYGITPVTLGTGLPAAVSVYWKTDSGFGRLD